MVDALRANQIANELSDEDIEMLDLQMKMLVYQTLDWFEDKQKIKAAALPARGQGAAITAETTYQGLMNEQFVSSFQLDVYGFITNTNYKYVIIKNETKTSNLGQKPSDDQVKMVRICISRIKLYLIYNIAF